MERREEKKVEMEKNLFLIDLRGLFLTKLGNDGFRLKLKSPIPKIELKL